MHTQFKIEATRYITTEEKSCMARRWACDVIRRKARGENNLNLNLIFFKVQWTMRLKVEHGENNNKRSKGNKRRRNFKNSSNALFHNRQKATCINHNKRGAVKRRTGQIRRLFTQLKTAPRCVHSSRARIEQPNLRPHARARLKA
jgi:hypothetical protein